MLKKGTVSQKNITLKNNNNKEWVYNEYKYCAIFVYMTTMFFFRIDIMRLLFILASL